MLTAVVLAVTWTTTHAAADLDAAHRPSSSAPYALTRPFAIAFQLVSPSSEGENACSVALTHPSLLSPLSTSTPTPWEGVVTSVIPLRHSSFTLTPTWLARHIDSLRRTALLNATSAAPLSPDPPLHQRRSPPWVRVQLRCGGAIAFPIRGYNLTLPVYPKLPITAVESDIRVFTLTPASVPPSETVPKTPSERHSLGLSDDPAYSAAAAASANAISALKSELVSARAAAAAAEATASEASAAAAAATGMHARERRTAAEACEAAAGRAAARAAEVERQLKKEVKEAQERLVALAAAHDDTKSAAAAVEESKRTAEKAAAAAAAAAAKAQAEALAARAEIDRERARAAAAEAEAERRRARVEAAEAAAREGQAGAAAARAEAEMLRGELAEVWERRRADNSLTGAGGEVLLQQEGNVVWRGVKSVGRWLRWGGAPKDDAEAREFAALLHGAHGPRQGIRWGRATLIFAAGAVFLALLVASVWAATNPAAATDILLKGTTVTEVD